MRYTAHMPSKATTVEQYLAELPDDRRAAISAVRTVFLKNLGKGYAEQMQYGMIGYCIPHSIFPAGYHCDPKQPLPFAGLASQKGHMSMYLMGLYMNPRRRNEFEAAWAKAGKKLDMGKACVRFKKLDDLALDVLAATLKNMPSETYIATYQQLLGDRATPASKATNKPTAKPSKPAAKKASSKTVKKSAKKAVSKSPRR